MIPAKEIDGELWIRAADHHKAIKEALAQPEPVRLRRGDILRSIETDELCTVWSTSTTGKTLIKWGANDFYEYTAEQIGELFWLEPSPDDLEIAAEKSDNYAAFHAGCRFAVAHSLAQPEQEPVAVARVDDLERGGRVRALAMGLSLDAPLYTTPPQPKEPEQEPVAYLDEGLGAFYFAKQYKKNVGFTPLYTTPPQREWVGLTDEEVIKQANKEQNPESFARGVLWAEAKLKEKNT